jgi:hypothetical protein
MNARRSAIITTRLPPAACGIGAYSVELRRHWPNESAVEFLVVDDAASAAPPGEGDRVTQFDAAAQKLTRELTRVGEADALLHYAGRAYQRFGCPTWMPGVLTQWKQKFPGSRLMIFFHELPGELPMTSRHYWLGQLNRRVVRKLASIADVLVTNTDHHGAILRQISRREDVHLLPVGSNIEVTAAPAAERDATEFVLFGMSFGRLQTLRLFADHVQQWHSTGRLTKLHLIGPAEDKFAHEAEEVIRSWPFVVRHGMLPAGAVSQLLAASRFALTNVNPETWGKSGTFMACAAHRCAVVVSGARGGEPPLSHTVGAEEVAAISSDEIDRRTAALGEWYYANADWPVIAARMSALW